MPQLEQYIGIEPGKDLITELATCMERFPNVKVRQIYSLERMNLKFKDKAVIRRYTVNVDIFAQLNFPAPSLWWYIRVDKFSRI